jgi:membrane fusion protein (multidrug efflux system)
MPCLKGVNSNSGIPNIFVPSMKKLPPWLIFVIVLVLAIAIKISFFSGTPENTNNTKGKSDKPQPVAVDFYIAKFIQGADSVYNEHGKLMPRQGFGTKEFSVAGKIGAFNQVELSSEISGRIVAIHIEEGDTVRKGDLLVQLNDLDIKSQLQKSLAQIAVTQKKLDRLKKLLEVKGVSQEEYETFEAELAVLKADEAYLQSQILKTKILAPFNGVIGLRNVSEGAIVNQNTPVVSIVQMKPVFVEFNVPNTSIQFIKRNTRVQLYSQNSMEGYGLVYAIEPRVDETTGTVRVRAKIISNGNYYPGSFVTVRVGISGLVDGMFIPSQAIVMTMKGSKILKVKQGVAVECPVITGKRKSDLIEVINGLEDGDTVITSGLMGLKPGMPVKQAKRN